MTALWRAALGVSRDLGRWLEGEPREVTVQRLIRPAWPIVAGSVARACLERGRAVLVLAPAPDRFAEELRPWLAGRPATYVFSEIAISFLDRPPAFDEAVNRRLEALAALTVTAAEPNLVISSRRA